MGLLRMLLFDVSVLAERTDVAQRLLCTKLLVYTLKVFLSLFVVDGSVVNVFVLLR